MTEARDIARALPDVHAMLNAVRIAPIRVERLAGAGVGVQPGVDSAFASSCKNRVTVYDPGAADLCETLRAAREIYTRAGVGHWFAEIGPGASDEQVASGFAAIGARVVPWVRYPVLAREPVETPALKTAMEVRRVSSAEAKRRVAEIDAIWGRPLNGGPAVTAADLPGYAVVLGFCEGKAVSMGMLLVANGAGYLCAGGTAAECRGRGGQSAVIAERVRIAREMGCRVCISETVSAVMTSQRNLERAGFGVAFEWVMGEVGMASVST